jgi:hypothetical protein
MRAGSSGPWLRMAPAAEGGRCCLKSVGVLAWAEARIRVVQARSDELGQLPEDVADPGGWGSGSSAMKR